jgi:hypothetical protein
MINTVMLTAPTALQNLTDRVREMPDRQVLEATAMST